MADPIARAYIRCSTEEQADSGLGLAAQLRKVTAAAQLKGFENIELYEDAGVTTRYGWERQPELVALLTDVQKGDVVFVARFDRIARGQLDFWTLVARSDAEGWFLVCLDPELDLATPNGRLVAGVIAAVAEWERRMISQRTREGLAEARARGAQIGAEPKIEEDLAYRILAMASPRGGGLSARKIARKLNEEEIPTPNGGTEWRHSSIQRLLARGRP